MRSWSIPAGRLFGVDIRIHLTFLFLLAFVWFTQSVTMGASGAIRGMALVAIVFLSVVLHELGHALVADRQQDDGAHNYAAAISASPSPARW